MKNRGFTIIEMTVASGIAAVVTLALSSLLVWAVMEFEGVKRRLQAQGEALRAELMLRRYVSTAIKVKDWGPAPNPWRDSTDFAVTNGAASDRFDGQGVFGPDFSYDEISDWPANGWRNVGFFLREWKEPPIGGNQNLRRSVLVETGIFLRAPSPTTSGVLFLDVSGTSPLGRMTPDYSDQWIGGIVEFSQERKIKSGIRHMVGVPGIEYTDNRIVSLLFTFKLRYHFGSSLPKLWCPSADITAGTAGCTGGAGYADLQRSVRIVLGNNNIGTRDNFGAGNEWVEERPMGYLHFFRPILPNVWEN